MGELPMSVFLVYVGVFFCQSAMAACLLCLWMDKGSSVHARVKQHPIQSTLAAALYLAVCLMPTLPAIKILLNVD